MLFYSFNRLITVISLSALCTVNSATAAGDTDVAKPALYYNFNHIDAITEQVISDSYVIINNGKIINMGSGTPPLGNYLESLKALETATIVLHNGRALDVDELKNQLLN